MRYLSDEDLDVIGIFLDEHILTALRRIENMVMATADEVAAVQAAADAIKAGVQRIEDALAAAQAGGAQPDPALDAAIAELKDAASSLDTAVPPATA